MSSSTEAKGPSIPGGAKVLRIARVSRLAGAHTGNTRHTVAGESMGAFPHLAIAQYDGNAGFYLLYCDEAWQVVTDTWHATLADAESQAEFEYAGVSGIWERLDAV